MVFCDLECGQRPVWSTFLTEAWVESQLLRYHTACSPCVSICLGTAAGWSLNLPSLTLIISLTQWPMANGRPQDIISRGDSEHLLSQAQWRLLYSSRPHSAWFLPLAALDKSASLRGLGNATLSFSVSLPDSEIGRFNEVKLNLYSDPKWLKKKNNNRKVLN